MQEIWRGKEGGEWEACVWGRLMACLACRRALGRVDGLGGEERRRGALSLYLRPHEGPHATRHTAPHGLDRRRASSRTLGSVQMTRIQSDDSDPSR